MAELILGAAGAWLGSTVMTGTFLGISGAGWGWMLGSMLGSRLRSRNSVIEGPQISDFRVSGSEYGQPITWARGSPRLTGQLWWASDKRPIRHESTMKVGKEKITTVTYTYDVDMLIGLTDNEIASISRIWINGNLIKVSNDVTQVALNQGLTPSSPDWSSRIAELIIAAINSASSTAKYWNRLTVYTGSTTQMPDPTYEAAVGAGNAPAYRGRSYVFIESMHLDQNGQIPSISFEVNTNKAFFPSSLDLIGMTTKTGYPDFMYYDSANKRLYVSSRFPSNSLHFTVCDFSDETLTLPVIPILGQLTVSGGTVSDVVAKGNYAYVGMYSGSLKTIDVSTPTAPSIVHTLSSLGSPFAELSRNMRLLGDYIYASANYDELKIISIVSPAAPSLITTMPLADFGDGPWGMRIVKGRYLVISQRIGYGSTPDLTYFLYIYDLINPTSPSLVSRTPIVYDDNSWACYIAASESGDWIYWLRTYAGTGANWSEIRSIDISNPASPVVSGTVVSLEGTVTGAQYLQGWGIECIGNKVYVTGAGYGIGAYVVPYGWIATLDITDNPGSPVLSSVTPLLEDQASPKITGVYTTCVDEYQRLITAENSQPGAYIGNIGYTAIRKVT